MNKEKLLKQELKIRYLLIHVLIFMFFSCALDKTQPLPDEIVIPKTKLADKIKGGWAGQVIGCTYGGPTEFRFNGSMIADYHPIHWNENLMLWWYKNSPGLYDDVYMDLTFVDVIEKQGLDASTEAHAHAFAHAGYRLWHANQAARYNVLNGINPPESGHWLNNPHADDIDFQIEADFAGLMAPGMVNSASEICDRVGHIMNYGDGWYGGVYVAAMYSLAFVSDNIGFIVSEALKTIPAQSTFYQCINDVIHWHNEFPTDWKQTWFETEKKWATDIGCPDGVFRDFNIDAKINAAYIVIGLLYGNGDYGKTIDISTRCGQDSDCNPASAAGILGTMLGYSNIPDYWKLGLDKVEEIDFDYTTMSLLDVCRIGEKHALEMILRNNGTMEGDSVTIKVQKPLVVPYEKAFEGHFPIDYISAHENKKSLNTENQEIEFTFTGKGFTIPGRSVQKDWSIPEPHVHLIDVYIDNDLVETSKMPSDFTIRKHDVTWHYNLSDTIHRVRLELQNPRKGFEVEIDKVIIYGSEIKDHTIQ